MSVWNGHYACACYHPLFVFNQFGDLERCALRPGNVHSADGWDGVLKPVVARARSHASIFERTRPLQCPRSTSFWRRSGSNTRFGCRPTRFCRAGSAICSRAQSDDLHTMCAGSMPISAIGPDKPRRVIAKVEWHPGELYPRTGFIVTNMSRPRARRYNKRGTCGRLAAMRARGRGRRSCTSLGVCKRRI